MRDFINNHYVLKANNFNTAIVDGNFPASTAYIDVSEFERFVFLVHAGTLNSALTLQVEQDTSATETASIKVVTGATDIVGTSDDDDVFMIEVETARLDIANGFRYVTLDVAGAGGGDDYLDIIFIGVNPRREPVTQPATTTGNTIQVAG
jgi:hypothetical protein